MGIKKEKEKVVIENTVSKENNKKDVFDIENNFYLNEIVNSKVEVQDGNFRIKDVVIVNNVKPKVNDPKEDHFFIEKVYFVDIVFLKPIV